jgi:DNA invertase Pin-like site-specific DNA recombinase
MIVGYSRVSAEGQNIVPQIELLQAQGCERIFKDVGSGVRTNREALTEMISILRKGDTVIVYKIDRIFRSLRDLVNLIETFKETGVYFKSIASGSRIWHHNS